MKTMISLSIALTLLLASFGYATHSGNVYFPEPLAGFTPKATYSTGFDKLWDAALNALDKNRIATVSADKLS
jgi:hypothetical protein